MSENLALFEAQMEIRRLRSKYEVEGEWRPSISTLLQLPGHVYQTADTKEPYSWFEPHSHELDEVTVKFLMQHSEVFNEFVKNNTRYDTDKSANLIRLTLIEDACLRTIENFEEEEEWIYRPYNPHYPQNEKVNV